MFILFRMLQKQYLVLYTGTGIHVINNPLKQKHTQKERHQK